MPKAKKYIIEKNYVAEEEISEIDFYLKDDLGIGDDDDETLTIDNDKGMSWAGASYPINIYRLIGLLDIIKDKHKCEYVEIMYHTDHIGYVLTGLNIAKYDEGSVKYKSILKKYKKEHDKYKQERIKELEEEINRLKKE